MGRSHSSEWRVAGELGFEPSLLGGTLASALDTARTAIRNHDWSEALDVLSVLDDEEGLSADDLLLLAEAQWWSAQPDAAVETFERAHTGLVKEGRPSEAARVGAFLAYFAMRRMAMSVAAGWIARVDRLLQGQPESEGHAWLEILYLAKAIFMDGDYTKAIAHADRAIELSRRLGVPGAQSLAMSFRAISMIQTGDWREGLVLLDEATVVAMSEGADLRAASDVYCNTIAACRNLADYRRAGEWTEEAERWMRAHSVGGYTGVCQVHRAELKRLRGSWPEAEQEARRACIELERFHLLDAVGFGQYEIGEVRRRMGDLPAAEEAFMKAYERGVGAQPGLALLMLDRDDAEGAAKSIAGSLQRIAERAGEEMSSVGLSRGRLLPAQVEIALAVDDLETARAATEELEEIAELYEGLAWEANAANARGALQLHEGDFGDAITSLGRAWRLWQELELPYESARARVLLGRALAASGDDVAAELELRAARSTFHRLGAETELRRLEGLTGPTDVAPSEAKGPRVTKAFMFTDIVTSTDLIGIIGDGAWEELLAWHDRALRAAFASAGGEVVRHTGDGFFVTFDEARAAVDCGVAIQRRLADHRRQHGFASRVRIGIHLATATRQGTDYAGQGVHAAARVGALAGGEEVVVSAQLLKAAGKVPYPVSEPETVNLKGISEPMKVHRLDWR